MGRVKPVSGIYKVLFCEYPHDLIDSTVSELCRLIVLSAYCKDASSWFEPSVRSHTTDGETDTQ